MMEYRNKKTGVIITVYCEISGEDWEPVTVPSSPVSEIKQKKKPAKKG